MVTEPKEEATQDSQEKKRSRISQSEIPMFSLAEALKIPQTICDNYAGQATTPLNVASSLKMLPNSSHFRMLCGSAVAYGLTDGGWNAKEIVVLQLAKRILSPPLEGDDLVAKREAALKPRIIGDFIRKYDKSPLPRRDIAFNVITGMGVPRDRVESVYQMILDTSQSIKVIREIKGKEYIDLSGMSVTKTEESSELIDEKPTTRPSASASPAANVAQSTKQLGQGIFIAHGKNKKPLEQLKKILDQFKIPYKVAIDEPNLGRPISSKVKETMESCNCAILIFTGDDEFFDKDGKSIWRPSENVIYELGASAFLYEKRIVLLKEENVNFASNFSDLGHISFAKDQLEMKSLDLIKELVGFGILKIST
ncbi:MAG: nucleotide-binding protein [Dehalococcoidia bacterium]|nr:nucleotide-binding protein [Dehalococcoidia bacterium]